MDKGLLLVISAPSGGGKGTILKELFAQDENLRLQKEIQGLTEELTQAQSDLAESESQLAEQGQALQALNLLYELQQEFSARDYEACEKTIAALEADGLKDTLSQEAREGLTSPAQRYQQLKDAVEHR